uniref:S-adenosyl-L-methionine-dependent methyltransferase n=1 Tax=Ananas comosus var. bracteatus TaxID=296719 RepID=A0A6V7PGL3_ANACO|nr:unnamed protein product [Ananas comosus var. bracteatus]
MAVVVAIAYFDFSKMEDDLRITRFCDGVVEELTKTRGSATAWSRSRRRRGTRAMRGRVELFQNDPLFIDPYAGCLLSLDVNHCDMEEYAISITGSSPSYYRIATKYIDDKLLNFVSRSDDLRQIVLLTDGMDTRPFRMNWPRSSILYDVSPERIFKVTSQRFKGVGAKVSRGCLLIHIPVESSNLLESFYRNGFNGGRPSIWALQGCWSLDTNIWCLLGLPLSTLASLNDLLLVISSLAMKGSIFLGELPACLEGNKFEDKTAKKERLEKLFMTYGFRVSVADYEEVAKEMHFSLDAPLETSNSVLFVAEQLRLSDAQMEIWRTQFERIEEEGDEEGFEEL